MDWSLTSTAFSQEAAIPQKHTADGADVSPELSWSAPPEGTVELALICNDPDAPAGDWIHWVLYGLSPDIRTLPEAVPTSGTLPDLGGAKQGRNDFGRIGYGGPSPPKGPTHHYHFRLYALDAPVNLSTGATAAELKGAMEGHILGETELVGLYSR
ncbi:MAG: YbhB/YbcL family Raf kinase inhibitor-like protein [Armatimonadetes bacterium]|nr:YbhB/YbcL family Raf kinase inhibitor-like protein [Armatimonadota bacterium]NIO74519.1 YbhB/YbcL family Raf kinase inhibitor-like protein [Armatimonadota bacterium]NIO98348.1 YbhB/YbcL family Raf kinase inhibitor-like protein [Armatimonadota bacterium]